MAQPLLGVLLAQYGKAFLTFTSDPQLQITCHGSITKQVVWEISWIGVDGKVVASSSMYV
jgi:hypothetical protein